MQATRAASNLIGSMVAVLGVPAAILGVYLAICGLTAARDAWFYPVQILTVDGEESTRWRLRQHADDVRPAGVVSSRQKLMHRAIEETETVSP
jgi:hypothetical protein